MANCLLLTFVLSEMVKYIAQMLLYLYPNLIAVENQIQINKENLS